MKSKLFGILSGASGIAAFVHAFNAGFRRSFDLTRGQMFDGYGREISPAPFPFSLLYSGGDGAWPGLTWMVVDWVAFFGLIFLAMRFLKLTSSRS